MILYNTMNKIIIDCKNKKSLYMRTIISSPLIGIVSLINTSSLKSFDCSNNQIISLENLPEGLEDLDCSNNKITSLDNLPKGLKILNCGGNKITSLDNLPEGLERIACMNNPIFSLKASNLFYKQIISQLPLEQQTTIIEANDFNDFINGIKQGVTC